MEYGPIYLYTCDYIHNFSFRFCECYGKLFVYLILYYTNMSKKYNVKSLILDLLSENDLAKHELLRRIRTTYGLSISDKTLNESLVKLLRDSNICVIGYDLSIYDGAKRVQSLKSDGIIFTKNIKK